MGFIKEPKGVDFIIQSEPLTDMERKEISKHITNYKEKNKKKKTSKTNTKQPAWQKHEPPTRTLRKSNISSNVFIIIPVEQPSTFLHAKHLF